MASFVGFRPPLRRPLSVAILHLGVGNFHRSHFALCTQRCIEAGDYDFGILGVGLLPQDREMLEDLKSQECLYTVTEKGFEGQEDNKLVVGSIIDVLLAPDSPQGVLERMADPSIKIVSLTITEKGYCYNTSTRALDWGHSFIQHDVATALEEPKSAVGYIAKALKLRKERSIEPFLVMSCDNLPENGHLLKGLVLELSDRVFGPEVKEWIEAHTKFPCSMVDRITPMYAAPEGSADKRPVVCESFFQWCIEDDLGEHDRPHWEYYGATLVKAVKTWELVKLRNLNAMHSALAYPAYLQGMTYVCDGANDPNLRIYLRKLMDEEVTPTLLHEEGIESIDLEAYKTAIISRFASTGILDTLERIAQDGASKYSMQLIPIIKANLEAGRPTKLSAFAIAAWIRHLYGKDDNGRALNVRDGWLDQISPYLAKGYDNAAELLNFEPIFGQLEGVEGSEGFKEDVKEFIASLAERGAAAVVAGLIA
mmetsp:Transcript_20455/g.38294  ORF Transcript_20455/g.38294 Transcript_20455/m.38294 type:complete len:481 (-) Transcript_20455:2866-4308(-)